MLSFVPVSNFGAKLNAVNALNEFYLNCNLPGLWLFWSSNFLIFCGLSAHVSTEHVLTLVYASVLNQTVYIDCSSQPYSIDYAIHWPATLSKYYNK